MANPFADAGFAPPSGEQTPAVNPFGAAGFAPAPEAPASPGVSPVIGATDMGAPIFAAPDDNAKVNEGQTRFGEKVAEGATFGMFPYLAAVPRWMGGTPYHEALDQARAYTAESSKQAPLPAAVAEGAGALAPTVLGMGAARPLVAAAEAAIPRVGGLVGSLLTGGALGGASSAGQDIGSGHTESLGTDTAKGAAVGGALSAVAPLLGAGVQAVPNMVRGVATGIRNIGSDAGRDAVAGQVLREAGGDFANTAARSPIPDLTLRTAQATGNPGLAALERTMASEPGAQATAAGDLVANGRTPNQMGALGRALVGSDAGTEPAVLANQASARGVQAITNLDNKLGETENALWNAAPLKAVRLNGQGIADGVTGDVANLPASWRDAVTGPQGKLAPFLKELQELGPNASIADINSVRSRLLKVARESGSGPAPDSATSAAANKMAGSILTHIERDPAMTGRPWSAAPGMTEMHTLPDGEVVPVNIKTQVDPGEPKPGAMAAYTKARDFSRNYHTTLGYNEFNDILYPNRSTNIQGNIENQFGRFFDTNGGTSAGLQRLQAFSDLARQNGAGTHAAELEGAAQQYMRARILQQARAGSGLDATGAPVTNPATLSSTINRAMPAISGTPMTAPIAQDVQAAGNAAELLNRPSTLRGDANSTTYEKLRNNDLVSAIIGQSGSSGVGAVAGGYAGGKYGSDAGLPWYLGVPGGAMAGALMGQRAGPYIGRAVASIPGAKALVTGPSGDIVRRVGAGLASPEEYQRLLATQLETGPNLSTPGAASRNIPALVRALIPQTTGGRQ